MAIIRLSITKPEKEWNSIVSSVSRKNHGGKGDGVARHIAMELSKRYAGKNSLKGDIAIGFRRRCFSIKISDEIYNQLILDASIMGVEPSDLISILILNPASMPVEPLPHP